MFKLKYVCFLVIIGLFGCMFADSNMPEIGTKAPSIQLKDQNGLSHDLKSNMGKWVLIYFYPKDDTPGCTKQACSIRDGWEELKNLDVVVYGISKDTVSSHKEFADKYGLPFTLLADPDGDIIKAYGVKGLFGYAKRVSFLISPKGLISKVMTSIDTKNHAQDIIKLIKQQKENH